MSVKPIPEGYHSVTPYIMVERASEFIDFTKKAFNAQETFRTNFDNGKIMHAEIKVGNSMLMLGEAGDQHPATPIYLYLYVEDVDAVYKQAVAAGGESISEPKNQFYGDRSAGIKDGFGNTWWIGTHVEDVSSEEMKRREEEMKKANNK